MQKIIGYLVVLVLIASLGCGDKKTTPTTAAQTMPSGGTEPTKSPAPSEDPSAMKVVITDGKMTINGIAIPAKPEVADIEKAAGKSSGSSGTGINNVIFWQDQGMKCLQNKDTKKVQTFNFYFDGYYDSESSSSSKPFKGSIVVDGIKVTAATESKELNAKLKLTEANGDNRILIYGNGTRVFFTVIVGTVTEVSFSIP